MKAWGFGARRGRRGRFPDAGALSVKLFRDCRAASPGCRRTASQGTTPTESADTGVVRGRVVNMRLTMKAALAALTTIAAAGAAGAAEPQPWELGLQAPASPVMAQLTD